MVAVQGAEPGTQARLGGQAVLRYTDHPLPSCHTSPRQGRATIWGCVTLIQARSCKSLTFSMSLFLFFFLGEGDAAVVGEQTPKHLATSSHLRGLDTPVHAPSRALPESGRLSRTPPLCRTKNLSCLQSHTPNLGCPNSWSSPRLPSQGAPSPVPLLGLWEFLDPPSPFSSPWVFLITSRRPTRGPKET